MSEMNSLTLNGKTYDCFVDGVARVSVVVCSASGESITVSDSSDQPLVGLNIYGKSTQAGTPTPDAPVDIKSIGDDGDVGVNVGNDSFVLMLEDGLRGVPVTDKSIATYTDGNGKMWCADEVDFERRVYVQRIKAIVFDGSADEKWATNSTNTGKYRVCTTKLAGTILSAPNTSYAPMLCDNYAVNTANSTYLNAVGISSNQDGTIYIFDTTYNTSDISLWQAHLNKNPMLVLVALKTPIETPLTEEQITAYKALHTNKPNTTITNGENAYMSMTYIADAKAYIDNKASGIIQATVE